MWLVFLLMDSLSHCRTLFSTDTSPLSRPLVTEWWSPEEKLGCLQETFSSEDTTMRNSWRPSQPVNKSSTQEPPCQTPCRLALLASLERSLDQMRWEPSSSSVPSTRTRVWLLPELNTLSSSMLVKPSELEDIPFTSIFLETLVTAM